MIKLPTTRTISLTATVAALLLSLQAFNPLWAQNGNTRPAEADRLHVVLLVAGNDGGIGNADMKDIESMRHAINVAFAKDKNRVVYHDLTGINKKTGKVYSANEIMAHLRGMKIGKNDNVLVFHSGHGGIADKEHPEESHILTVDGGRLARRDIRNILSAKQPRALMILTDCCSSYMNVPRALAAEQDVPAAVAVNVATVRNLLLKPAGLVNITAAKDGTEAVAASQGANPGQAGSAFTVAMMRLWYRMDVTFTSWEQMFPALRSETVMASGGRHEARAFQISTGAVGVVAQPVAPVAQPVMPVAQPVTQPVPQGVLVQQRFRS
jgi:hypothetical protein